MTKTKDSKILILKKIIENKRFIYFTFENTDSVVSINRETRELNCNCYNGSCVGVNQKQICYHKKFVLEKYNINIEEFKKKKSI